MKHNFGISFFCLGISLFWVSRAPGTVTVQCCPCALFNNAQNVSIYERFSSSTKGIQDMKVQAARSGIYRLSDGECPDLTLAFPLIRDVNRDAIPTFRAAAETLVTWALKIEWNAEFLMALYEASCSSERMLPARGPNIFIIGGGFGREVDWLLRRLPNSLITVIEHSHGMAEYLKDKYRLNLNVRIFEEDLLTWNPDGRYNVVLWSWSGVYEFNESEKPIAFRRLSQIVDRPGFLLVEFRKTIEAGMGSFLPIASTSEEDYFVVQYEDAVDTLHVTDGLTLAQIAKDAGFKTDLPPLIYKTFGPSREIRIFSLD